VHITGALKSITRTAYDLTSFFDFKFVIPKNSKGRFWIENNGFSYIEELPMRELSRRYSAALLYLPYLVINAMRLKRIVQNYSIELIHVNDIYNLLPVVIRLLGLGTPYVCHIRFLPDRFPAPLLKFWLKLHFRFAAKIIAVSEKVKQQLPDHPKIVVIHNELPVEERYPYIPACSSPKESYTFLYLSNVMQGKGQDLALQAFGKIHRALPNWTLRFVGGDMGLAKNRKYGEDLKSMAKALDIDRKVGWKEFTQEVEWELKHADIVLNFSESESFSITCLEALFFGRPLIATDSGGPAEIIDHMETGILVPNRSVEAMAEAMLNLANDCHLRDNLSNKARIVVKQRFSVEQTSYKLKEVYDKAIGSVR
jgi:L-malate glycosyltransferase